MTDDDKKALIEQRATARSRLITRLENEGAFHHSTRLKKCGEEIHLRCSCCQRAKTAYKRCDLKYCPSCTPRLAFDRTKKYGPVVDTFSNPLFITLTTRNFDARSKKETGIRAVRKAFTKLRAQRWWKKHVAGGVAGFEMTRRNKGWHPHVHAVIDSNWFAVELPPPGFGVGLEEYRAHARRACEEVAAKWTKALGGRKGSVKVRKVKLRPGQSVSDCLREVLKYSITAESLDNITGTTGLTLLLDELALTRNTVGFGSAYRHPALKKPEREQKPCEKCGEFGTYLPEEILIRQIEKEDRQYGRKHGGKRTR